MEAETYIDWPLLLEACGEVVRCLRSLWQTSTPFLPGKKKLDQRPAISFQGTSPVA